MWQVASTHKTYTDSVSLRRMLVKLNVSLLVWTTKVVAEWTYTTSNLPPQVNC